MIGKQYEHRNGNIYTVLLLTNTDSSRERQLDHPVDVIYKGKNGNIWSRRLSDWNKSFKLITKKLYYIRNEGFLGNALMWWQEGGSYTCDITKAAKFDKVKAKNICQRPEDSAYECSYIDQLSESKKIIIDSQYVDSKKRLWVND